MPEVKDAKIIIKSRSLKGTLPMYRMLAHDFLVEETIPVRYLLGVSEDMWQIPNHPILVLT